jgi:hypothetical protein
MQEERGRWTLSSGGRKAKGEPGQRQKKRDENTGQGTENQTTKEDQGRERSYVGREGWAGSRKEPEALCAGWSLAVSPGAPNPLPQVQGREARLQPRPTPEAPRPRPSETAPGD